MIALKIQQVRMENNPFEYNEYDAVIEENLMYNMFQKFKDYVNQMKPEDIIEITDEYGLKRYELIVKFETASDDLKLT